MVKIATFLVVVVVVAVEKRLVFYDVFNNIRIYVRVGGHKNEKRIEMI